MHDDDLPDDDIRDALERRARRAEPAGADALLARSDAGASPEHRGRGAWMAAAAALVLSRFARARFVVTIYGLELTYSNPIARGLMRRGARACDRVVVISEATRRVMPR